MLDRPETQSVADVGFGPAIAADSNVVGSADTVVTLTGLGVAQG